LSLANLRAELAAFEGRYLREVGILYAELDDWNAKIAESVAEAAGTERVCYETHWRAIPFFLSLRPEAAYFTIDISGNSTPG
jgi:sulfur relay (sulfurtransferase) DsrC/TusE family protein